MVRRALLVALAALAAASAACFDTKVSFQCANDGECSGGECIDDFCAFDDLTCPSGKRYGDLSGDRAGACVEPAHVDAGPDAASPDARADGGGGDGGVPGASPCIPGLRPDDACVDSVCAAEPYCCNPARWDPYCARRADDICELACGRSLAVANRAGDGLTAGVRVYRWNGSSLELFWSRTSAAAQGTRGVGWGARAGAAILSIAEWEDVVRLFGVGATEMEEVFTGTQADDFQSTAWGDCDGDGDLDVGFGGVSAPVTVLENDAGTFVEPVTSGSGPQAEEIAWGDILGDDGVLEAVYAGFDSQTRVFESDGACGMTARPDLTPAMAERAQGIALGDCDGDGDLDLALANTNGPSRVLRWEYDPTDEQDEFLPAWDDGGDLRHHEDAAFADFDGDGDLDLAFAVTYGGSFQNRVYLNDGNCDFGTSPIVLPEMDWSYSVIAHDIDDDGHPDLVFGNGCNDDDPPAECGPVRLYLNDGKASFTLAWSSTELDGTEDISWSFGGD